MWLGFAIRGATFHLEDNQLYSVRHGLPHVATQSIAAFLSKTWGAGIVKLNSAIVSAFTASEPVGLTTPANCPSIVVVVHDFHYLLTTSQ